jgi:hypothetical protein
MVDTDNAKSKREFKKLSKCMGDKLDKEKGRYVDFSFFPFVYPATSLFGLFVIVVLSHFADMRARRGCIGVLPRRARRRPPLPSSRPFAFLVVPIPCRHFYFFVFYRIVSHPLP